jgi:hypothetical protein
MIKTAAQILAGMEKRHEDHRASHLRKVRGEPVPCANTYRGCTGTSGGSRGGRGWCSRCYDRDRKHDDSWHHSPNVQYCTKVKCFMKGTPGHP